MGRYDVLVASPWTEVDMRVCIPIVKDEGTNSELSGHFGSAPKFFLADSEDHDHRVVDNGNLHHGHGQCSPVAALRGQAVDAVVVRGIGRGAYARLTEMGVAVYLADSGTVATTLEALAAGTLKAMTDGALCGGHYGPCHGSTDG